MKTAAVVGAAVVVVLPMTAEGFRSRFHGNEGRSRRNLGKNRKGNCPCFRVRVVLGRERIWGCFKREKEGLREHGCFMDD